MRHWLAGCLLLVSAEVAKADNAGNPMTFQLYRYDSFPSGQHLEIDADGVILAATPDQFAAFLAGKAIPPGSDVYLTSEGGNLMAGLQLGRMIRQHGFNTIVAAHRRISDATVNGLQRLNILFTVGVVHTPVAPTEISNPLEQLRWASYCISSCTFALLGGVKRYAPLLSSYAVHKFHNKCDDPEINKQAACHDPSAALSGAQELSAELAMYLEQMGVSQNFLHDMIRAEPDKLNVLSPDDLKRYQICTDIFGGCFLR